MLIPTEERAVSVLGDEYSSRRVFAINRFQPDMQDLSALTFRLDFRYSPTEKNTTILTKTVEDDRVLLVWDIISNDLPYTGTIFIQVRGTDDQGTVKWRSFETAVYCEQGISSQEGFTGSLSEIERLENSVSKVIDSEEKRKENEISRQTNETGRQTAETARHEYFDEIQKTDVAKALLSEKERVEAENARKAAETIRQSEEAKRQGEESTRNQKETERITAESKRVIAEAAREAVKTDMVMATGTANTAADRANDAAQAAEDVVISKLPVATESTVGVVKSGGDITVEADGKVTVNGRETPQGAQEKAEAARAAAVQTAKEWAGETFSNPNLLINGGFQVWQRGTDFIGIEGYSADRWKRTDHVHVEKTNFGLKSTFIGGVDYCRFITQIIENHERYYAKMLSFSCKIRLSRGDMPLRFGHKNTQDWQVCTITYNTSDAGFVSDWFVIDSGAKEGDWIEIQWAKLELGEVATPFVPRSDGEELALCLRYYQNELLLRKSAWGEIFLHMGVPCVFNLLSPMRINPKIIFSGDEFTTEGTVRKWGQGIILIPSEVAFSHKMGFNITIDNIETNSMYFFDWKADAEIY